MPRRSVRLAAPADGLRETFAAIRARIGIPETFAPDVLAEAERSARQPRLPDLLQEAAVLFRAASYVAFDGQAPPDPMHAALAARYAHCTAPLRRLGDRYVNEVCLALCAGLDVPMWARDALPALPIEMALGAERGNRLERTVVDAVEAAVLAPQVGQESDALVIDLWKRGRGEVALRHPAVIGPCDGVHELGAKVRVRLEEADVTQHTIRFATVAPSER